MLRFRVGDRVCMAGFDVVEPGIPTGSMGTVLATIHPLTGKSGPYPDPANRLVLVKWDALPCAPIRAVARQCLEKMK